jgi:hypothetical protein
MSPAFGGEMFVPRPTLLGYTRSHVSIAMSGKSSQTAFSVGGTGTGTGKKFTIPTKSS